MRGHRWHMRATEVHRGDRVGVHVVVVIVEGGTDWRGDRAEVRVVQSRRRVLCRDDRLPSGVALRDSRLRRLHARQVLRLVAVVNQGVARQT